MKMQIEIEDTNMPGDQRYIALLIVPNGLRRNISDEKAAQAPFGRGPTIRDALRCLADEEWAEWVEEFV